jgi:hypothetical protein
MTILFDSTATRKPARFGAGLSVFVPFAVTAPGFIEPSDADRAAVGSLFADIADWDARPAADASGDDCEACGRPVERGELVGGLCNVCQCRAEEATMASQYAAAGMGWKSY